MSYETCENQLAIQLNNVSGLSKVNTASFTGSGLNDATFGGTFTGSLPTTYRVQIDNASASPNTFKWSNDDGVSWEATGVAITGSAQTLENGVTVTFAATTGHTLAERWDSLCETWVGRGDWGVLARGGANKMVLLQYQSFEQDVVAFGGKSHQITWKTKILLAARYKAQDQEVDDMRDLRQAVIDRLNQYPHLGSSSVVWRAEVTGGEVEEFQVDVGGVSYQLEAVNIEMVEEFAVTYQE